MQTTLAIQDFVVTVTPSVQQITCGQSGTATVQINGINGLSDNFSVQVQWLGRNAGAPVYFASSSSPSNVLATGSPATIVIPTAGPNQAAGTPGCTVNTDDTQFWVSVTATSDTYNVQHSLNEEIIGDFAPNVGYVIQTSPQPSNPGLTVLVDGFGYSNSKSFAWPSNGATHTFSVASPQVVNGTTYAFVNWSDGSTQQTRTIAVGSGSSPATYTANFSTTAPDFTISATTSTGSISRPGAALRMRFG